MNDSAENILKHVLIVDDEENMRHMLSVLLTGEGYLVDTAANGKEAIGLLESREFDFVLCDIRMPEMDGLAFLGAAEAVEHGATVIMMSAFGSVDTALEAMKRGAYDFISKPFKTDEVVLVLKKAEERERLRRENIFLKRKIAELEKKSGFGAMIGKSKAMQEVFTLAEKVAEHPTTVLITGESGTGKELVAAGIHAKSGRADKPFIAVNCGSVPENLLESEFFGYVRGAFTGADRDKKGLFEEAHKGTLFLDEIGELPLSMQVKLLRVLQEQEIRLIGSAQRKKIDVRILAATARDISGEVQQGRFREDLFYRLNVINILVPPLRNRSEDIPVLCDYFVKKFTKSLNRPDIEGLSHAALQQLLVHAWPGNVRELENVLERAVILTEGPHILPENLPENIQGSHADNVSDFLAGISSVKEGRRRVEERLIRQALEATEGNKSKAAQILEISYPSLLSKIKEFQKH
ncbi:two component, sigma54 specific, transcriptional regulator, Fis family [Candidatus Electrothrix marina]|uniref:Two component, sigma54 specific, transcriptional regulator, Fis family n=2 Tax=Candidatus Electrothrix marina TaxID=1859130 RepID=A0A3S3RXC2_9BACT|nr:two component, sigma54 specific, transcriptional regulator, Fis family [Candidatus Electrothrix marina]RWX52259.1 two component, sigma54 specific, transcriptional regulator, Fis family [Candidatus Electrothrix marina]